MAASFFGDFRRGALRLEKTGVFKQRAEHAPVFRLVDLVVGEFVRFLNRAVEVGADDVAVKVANHEQGRIEQAFAVALELRVGFVEVLFLALVFPGEAVLPPHVGKAALVRVAGVRDFEVEKLRVFDDPLLEAEEIAAAGVGFGRGLLPKQSAEVVEVLLVRGGFLARVAGPFALKFSGRHCLPSTLGVVLGFLKF